MPSINRIGADWLADQIDQLTDHIEHVTPSDYNEANRYLPESVTSLPGFIRYNVNPFMREIVDCFDVDSPVREVSVKKGVQITYSTLLESGLLYMMGHVRTLPVMYMTADKELAKARIENNIIPMINQSGMDGIIRSSDTGNARKSGKTADHIQWDGGGYLVPFGARNADKMRSYSIAVMLKDEIDAWPDVVGKDGDPDALSDDRCSGYWERRKIFRGSTPLIAGSSKIQKAFLNGDQRIYRVLCRSCNFPQGLRWNTTDKKTGVIGGFLWDMQDGRLQLESVRYACQSCGHEHFEHDKERLFAEDGGAHWHPTETPKQPNIRSYHLPATYSPIGMQPWYKCVAAFLDGFDPKTKKVIDAGKYQVFRNNILAEPYKVTGMRISKQHVSAHRRMEYRKGEIPNKYAIKYSGSKILFLTCQVDVHKRNLAVSVMGWTRDARNYIVDYQRFEVDENTEQNDCGEPSNPVWSTLRQLIEEKTFTADDGTKYNIAITLIDAGYQNDTVTTFCADYESGVYPILGRDRPAKNQTIKEFAEFTTQSGTVGFRILVDHYKDRLAPVLRREWSEASGLQDIYHFNAPVDIKDNELYELTVESRKQKLWPNGSITSFWHRPVAANNELWDLLVYGHAAVEILAYKICIQYFELDTVDWQRFWDYIEENHVFFAG